MDEINLKLQNLIEISDTLFLNLYNELTARTWDLFFDYIDSLQETLKILNNESLLHKSTDVENIVKNIQFLKKQLSELENALIQKDFILMGDIINYEVKEILKDISLKFNEVM